MAAVEPRVILILKDEQCCLLDTAEYIFQVLRPLYGAQILVHISSCCWLINIICVRGFSTAQLQVHDHSPNGPAPTILKEGNVVTCEPGLYFVDSILGQALNNTEKKHFLVEDALSSWKHIGGVFLSRVLPNESCILL